MNRKDTPFNELSFDELMSLATATPIEENEDVMPVDVMVAGRTDDEFSELETDDNSEEDDVNTSVEVPSAIMSQLQSAIKRDEETVRLNDTGDNTWDPVAETLRILKRLERNLKLGSHEGMRSAQVTLSTALPETIQNLPNPIFKFVTSYSFTK